MKSILADYSDSLSECQDGRLTKICPHCHRAFLETDLEVYYADGSDHRIEICSDCRSEIEADLDVSFDSDVVAPAVYAKLVAWIEESASEPEPVPIHVDAAKFFDGEYWDSGGGVGLILIARPDNKLTVISSECVAVYETAEAFHEGAQSVMALNFRG